MKPKVLYVCHNHPVSRPGGAEAYAAELYDAVREAGEFEPTFVAKAGPPITDMADKHAGTRFALLGEDPNVYFFYTHRDEIDMVMGTARDKRMYTEDWRAFLQIQQPDLVHFQHTLFLGFDMVRETRNTLPGVPILYTLHEFLPICHHSGQMVRTDSLELCDHATPRRCHQCFPKIPEDMFFLRERYVKAALEHVDLFIAPSEQLRRRYVEWGIPEDKIVYEDYGRLPVTPVADPPDAGRRRRVAFFGQVTRFKGVDVLLEAMKILAEQEVDVELLLYGANIRFQAPAFQAKVKKLLEETEVNVRFRGSYDHAQLPSLLAAVDWVVVPSIWWENSPLVIQEALMYGRPIITSDVGGMAEKVHDGVTGLHFTVRDPYSLADAIRRAVSSPEMWDAMRANITGAHPMDEHLTTISDHYRRMLAGAPSATAAA